MNTILQISDFHISAKMPLPSSNPKFTGMIKKIKSLNIDPNEFILVYNGDVIDSRSIINSIDKSMSNNEKATHWDREAEKSYKKAKEYFDYFAKELSIRSDRVIICCGNHDVNPYYEPIDDIPCTILDDSKRPYKKYASKRFFMFSKFCGSLLPDSSSYTPLTYSLSIDNLNFLIINTNWINKWEAGSTQPLCIGCKDIQAVIDNQKQALISTKNTFNRLSNILVAHSPRTDYCENALYHWPEIDGKVSEKTEELIDRYFGLKLYGDKHTDNKHYYDYIVGAPLDSDNITLGIHRFDNEHHHHHFMLKYKNDQWDVQGSEDDIGTVLSISEKAIKGRALDYLFGKKQIKEIELEREIKNFEIVRLQDNWKNLDKLFKSSSDLKECFPDGSKKDVEMRAGFINVLTSIISESKNTICLTVRGEYRVGKSVCMSVLYLNLLYRFITGTIEYMPVYIDAGQIREELSSESERDINMDTKQYCDKFMSKFKSILLKGLEKAREWQRPTCCIIDGIDQFVIYKKANIEEKIWQTMNSGAGKDYSRIVYCLDKGPGGIDASPQHDQKESQFIMYMNRILTKKVQTDKYSMFIESFCKLRGLTKREQVERIIKQIDQMNILEIDTNLLLKIWDELKHETFQPTKYKFFEMVEALTKQEISPAEINKAARVCHQLYLNTNENNNVGLKLNEVSNKTFEIIRTQREISHYLIALNYINHVKKNDLKPEEFIYINELFNHTICSYIRSYITVHNLEHNVLHFANTIYKKLNYSGIATITFFLGRLNKTEYGEQVIKTINDIELTLMNTTTDLSATVKDRREMDIAKRSVIISRVFMNHNEDTLINYINALITNDAARRVNRAFYLRFYGDRNLSTDLDDIVLSFDIYNTYHLLANRLKDFREKGQEYTLLPLELFTLCDLLQIRLDNPKAKKMYPPNSEPGPSFFYDQRFNRPNNDKAYNTLAFILPVIDRYLSMFGTKQGHEFFSCYLKTQRNYFNSYLKKLEKGVLDSNADGFDPISIFRTINQLNRIKRLGWYIQDKSNSKLTKEEYNQLQQKELIESALEHTFSCYVMGVLYLPTYDINNPDYDKQIILNMIMIHDWGETKSGDILSFCENEDDLRIIENCFAENLYMMGTKSNISNLTYYLQLWIDWKNQESVNAKIAKDIDKIQRLYEMLTLLQENRIQFSNNRILDFWTDRDSIATSIGKEIYNIVIARNKSFKSIVTNGSALNSIIMLDELR